MSDAPQQPRVLSKGIELTLLRAATDPAFRSALKTARAHAAQSAGIVLSPSERAVLDSIGDSQLDQMIACLPPVAVSAEPASALMMPAGVRPDVSRGTRPGLPIALAAGTLIAGGAAGALMLTHGVRPDMPPPALHDHNLAPESPSGSSSPNDAGSDSDTGPDSH